MNAMCVVTARCNVDVQSWSKTYPMPDCSKGEAPRLGYVKLNGTVILNAPSCTSTSPGADHIRGTHIQLIDPFACTKIESRQFDTYASEDEAANLTDYLDQLDKFSVIVGSMVDEASNSLSNAYDGLLRVGIDLRDLGWKGSFAFVAQKSAKKTVLNKSITATISSKNQAHVNAIITGM